ncbi:hypothetical protein I546_6250 [Mycobacterium kansasii 732]|nr:hypothetical protein I546_6250 [Mycobacterium kansasii 732]
MGERAATGHLTARAIAKSAPVRRVRPKFSDAARQHWIAVIMSSPSPGPPPGNVLGKLRRSPVNVGSALAAPRTSPCLDAPGDPSWCLPRPFRASSARTRGAVGGIPISSPLDDRRGLAW